MVRRVIVSSTNELARELALEGAAHGTVVLADSQSHGKGRLGRQWHSPPGLNIYMSVILRPSQYPVIGTSPGLVPLLAGLSVLYALRECTGLVASLKWPNDIIAGDRKLGGILLEARSRGGGMDHAILGMGINVNSNHGDFPPELKGAATSLLMETGRKQDTEGIIRTLSLRLSTELDSMHAANGPEEMIKAYKAACSTLGRKVKALTPEGETTGTAVDIDGLGRLVMEIEGEHRALSSADITHLA